MADQEQQTDRWLDLRADGTYQHNPDAPEITAGGINVSALRRNRMLTPEERLKRMAATVRMVEKLRSGFRSRRHGELDCMVRSRRPKDLPTVEELLELRKLIEQERDQGEGDDHGLPPAAELEQ